MTAQTIDQVSTLTPFPPDAGYQWHACLYPGCTAIFKARTAGYDEPHCPKHRDNYPVHADNGGRRTTRYQGTAAWEIVRDPLPQEFGGYRPGNCLQHHEIREMLDLGLGPPGLQLRYHDTVYTVVRKRWNGHARCYLRARGKLYNYSDIKAGRG